MTNHDVSAIQPPAPPPTDDQILLCRRVAFLEARRRGLSQADADDVAQDTCLALWMALVAGKEIKSVGGWARTTAGRRVVDSHRLTAASKRGGGLLESLDELLVNSEIDNCVLRHTQ